MNGKIIRVNVLKGYGFIEGSDKKDYFFHFSDVNKSGKAFRFFEKGDEVDFEIGDGSKPDNCKRAFKVKVLEKESATETVKELEVL